MAKKHKDAIFFLAGRLKSEPGTDFSDDELEAAKIIATSLQMATAQKLNDLITAEILKEMCHDHQHA